MKTLFEIDPPGAQRLRRGRETLTVKILFDTDSPAARSGCAGVVGLPT